MLGEKKKEKKVVNQDSTRHMLWSISVRMVLLPLRWPQSLVAVLTTEYSLGCSAGWWQLSQVDPLVAIGGVQLSSVPWPIGSSDRHERRFSRDPLFCWRPLWAVLAWAEMSTLLCWPSSIFSADHDFARPHRCHEKNGSGEAAVACDMAEPCKFPSLDSCQKRILWTYKWVDLAPHPVVDLVFQVRDAQKFPLALAGGVERV